MELQQLRGFCEVAREGSFTRAAARLFVTQPAVSQQIRALEAELDQVLLERSGRSVKLTEAGQILFRRAGAILAEVEAARQEVAALGEVMRGRVVVGTSDTNCSYVLPGLLTAFRAAHPGVAVEVRNRMSSEVGQLVLEDRVDFGLATLPVRHRSLVNRALFTRRDVLVCPPGHRLARRRSVRMVDLAGEPLLLLEQGSRSRALLDQAFAAAGLHPTAAMDLGSIEVIKRFAEIGCGLAVVPAVAVAREVDEGRLAAVPVQGLLPREIGLVLHRGRQLPAPAAAFVARMEEALAGKEL
ncbi:MAG: LysR family transcriptional regulator [Gemmatimonadota bacterium]